MDTDAIRHAVSTPAAPTPTGPFSQAIRVGGLVFTAGQAGRNQETHELGDLADQTHWTLRNLDAFFLDLYKSVKSAAWVYGEKSWILNY